MKYCQTLNLPSLPSEIEQLVMLQARRIISSNVRQAAYSYAKASSEIDLWCRQNICESAYWMVQVIQNNMPPHVDSSSKIKLNYLLELGGTDVATEWVDNNNQTLESIICQKQVWYLLQTNTTHKIVNVTATRVSIAAKVF